MLFFSSFFYHLSIYDVKIKKKELNAPFFIVCLFKIHLKEFPYLTGGIHVPIWPRVPCSYHLI